MGDLRLDFGGADHLLRGSLHCHSDRSDGACSPEVVLSAYREAGYDFVAITDHFEAEYGHSLTLAPGPPGLIVIPAAEFSTGAWSERSTCWVAAIGLSLDFSTETPEDGLRVIAAAREAGAWTILLHPRLNHWRPFESGTPRPVLELIDAVEIYNHSMAATWPDQAEGSSVADELLEAGLRPGLVAADDAHFVHPHDRFGAWVMVAAQRPDEGGVLDALRMGRYYSTQGPRLDRVELRGRRLSVHAPGAYSVCVTGAGERWLDGHHSFPRTEAGVAELDVSAFAGSFCRVTVVSRDGLRAWSNPLWIDH
jgi:hypothetical protein